MFKGKFRKIIAIGVIVIMCVTAFVGCERGRKIWYNVSYSALNIEPSFNFNGQPIIINSFDELEAAYPYAYQEDDPNYGSELSSQIRTYDSSFFAGKALLICLFGTPNTGTSVKIDNVRIQGNTLFLYVTYIDTGASWQILSSWLSLCEVNKANMTKITKFEVMNNKK